MNETVKQLQIENKRLKEALEGAIALLINSGLMSKTESVTNIDSARLWLAVPHMLQGLKLALSQLILVDPTPEGDEIKDQLRAIISQAESAKPTKQEISEYVDDKMDIGTTLANQPPQKK